MCVPRRIRIEDTRLVTALGGARECDPGATCSNGGTRTEVSIRPLGADAAAVLHRWQGEGTFAGQFFKDDHRCTMICVRRDGKWRIALEHCSPNGPDGDPEVHA